MLRNRKKRATCSKCEEPTFGIFQDKTYCRKHYIEKIGTDGWEILEERYRKIRERDREEDTVDFLGLDIPKHDLPLIRQIIKETNEVVDMQERKILTSEEAEREMEKLKVKFNKRI